MRSEYAPMLPGFYERPSSAPFSGATPETVATSKAAAVAASSHADSDRERIYRALVNCWPDGLTDAELQKKLGMDGNTQRPRRVELERAKRIQQKGTRKTESGRYAVIWTLA